MAFALVREARELTPSKIRQQRAIPILGTAALYFLVARLAVLLALPPGYATAVWPAAGLALLAVLLLGRRAACGVLLGSFLANAWTAAYAPGPTTWLTAFVVPLAIGIGAALQALAGGYLVGAFAGPSGSGAWGRHLRLVLLGGPLSCLISASVGIATLLASGLLALQGAAFSWFTWWVGDTIGVVVFTPLGLIWADRRLAWRRKVAVSLPVAATFALVVAVYVAASAWERRQLQADLERRAAIQVRAMSGTIESYVDALFALGGLFASSNVVTEAELREFVDGLLARYPHAQGFSWNPLVRGDARRAFERERGLLLRELDADGRLVPARPRGEHVPVSFIEPRQRNERALGFDLASDPVRREALARARDSGEATATAPVTLVQEKTRGAGVVYFLPIYRRGAPRATLAQRRENLEGYVALVLHVPRLLGATLRGLDEQGLLIEVDDAADAAGLPLFSNRPGGRAAVPEPAAVALFREVVELEHGGRRWRIQFTLAPRYLAAHRPLQAWTILAAGLLFTGLLGVFLLEVAERLTTVEELVGRRTEELAEASAALREQNDVLSAVAAGAELMFQAGSWEEVAELVLGQLGVALEVSRVSIFETVVTAGEPAARYRFGWQAAGHPPLDMTGWQDAPFRAAGFGRWLDLLQRGEIVHGAVRGFPADERLQLERQGVRSLAVVPVRVGERFWGFLGFDDCQQERRWSDLELLALRVAGDTLGAAIGDKERDQRLQASERRYRTMVEDSPAFICTHTLDGEVLSMNPAAVAAVGRPAEEIVGRSLAEILAPDVRRQFEEHFATTAAERPASGTMVVRTAGGEDRVWQFHNRLVEEPGQQPYVLGHAVDVTDRRRLEIFLREQAFTDPLTRLANRALFDDRLAQALEQAKRRGHRSPTPLALAVLDLDGFKEVNDRYGHAVGDAVLREVAARLRDAVRAADTVARLGGDEFAVVLPDVGSVADAHRLIDKLFVAVRGPIVHAGTPLAISFSVGVSLFPDHGDTTEELVAAADAAMYAAKQAGKDRCCFSGEGPTEGEATTRAV